jgi:hypothetical protein
VPWPWILCLCLQKLLVKTNLCIIFILVMLHNCIRGFIWLPVSHSPHPPTHTHPIPPHLTSTPPHPTPPRPTPKHPSKPPHPDPCLKNGSHSYRDPNCACSLWPFALVEVASSFYRVSCVPWVALSSVVLRANMGWIKQRLWRRIGRVLWQRRQRVGGCSSWIGIGRRVSARRWRGCMRRFTKRLRGASDGCGGSLYGGGCTAARPSTWVQAPSFSFRICFTPLCFDICVSMTLVCAGGRAVLAAESQGYTLEPRSRVGYGLVTSRY